MRRRALVLVVTALVGATMASGTVSASPTKTTTVSCKQAWSSFNVQLIGDRDWGWSFSALGSIGVPKEKALIVVWSMGGKIQGGLEVYSWSSATRTRPSPRCSPVKAALKPPSLAGLGPRTTVSDGWAFGRKFACLDPGRILVTTTATASKTRVVVRMQASGKVIAVGEVGGGGGWLRGSTSCDEREK